MLFYKLLSIVILCHMVINGESLDNNGDRCNKSRAKTVRLQGLTKYAGRAEICWSMDNDEYRWFHVCSDKWTFNTTRDMCNQLNYFNTITDFVPYPCSDNSCKAFPLVSVNCTSGQDCRNKSITLCSGRNKRLIFIICDTATLISTLFNYVAMDTEDSVSDGVGIPALAGVLGGTIMVMMGVLLGLVWYYQRKLQKIVHTYSNRRNSEHGPNPESRYNNTHSSNYIPSTTQESTYRTDTASVLLWGQSPHRRKEWLQLV